MKNPSDNNASRLETQRRTKDQITRWAWLVTAGSVAVLALIIAAIADQRFLFGRPVRIGFFVVLCAIVLVGATRLLLLLRRRSTLKQVALELENQNPQTGCVISTVAEYISGEKKPNSEYEPEIVEALHQQAANNLQAINDPNRSRFIKYAAAALVVAVIFCLFLAIAPAPVTAIQRVAQPWSDASYTTFRVMPGTSEVAIGADQQVQCVFQGLAPRNPQLLWRVAGSTAWNVVVLNAGEKTNSYTFNAVSNSVEYAFAANGAESVTSTLKAFAPPKIASLNIKVQMPGYTGRAAYVSEDANVTVLRGSQLDFQMATSGDVVQVNRRGENPSDTAQQSTFVNASPNAWTHKTIATTNTDYSIDLLDRTGHKGGSDKPFHLLVTADDPPKVVISQPGTDIRADPTNKIPLTIEATDDYGLSDLKLVFNKLSSPEQTVVLPLNPTNRLETKTVTEIDLSKLQLADFDVVAYHAEARDNNTLDGPGVGKSPVYFIEITSREKPLSQCQGGGSSTSVNLLTMEKQVLGATVRANSTDATKLDDIAVQQDKTREYAEMFKASPLFGEAPPEAMTKFESAIENMGRAKQSLSAHDKTASMKAEEQALADLYQTAKLLPEFESQCRGGNCKGLKILLQAIEKEKKQKHDSTRTELAKLLQQLKQTKSEQKQLQSQYASACQNPGNGQPNPN
ncbi:MAG: hypothetical protein JWO95_1044, partial [Verrucomicrobiales bacterium]|nr:hypothetical protein [Verrucomicrobiales bacterium]